MSFFQSKISNLKLQIFFRKIGILRFNQGFSLIEILVVIALFSLTAFVVAAAYSAFERNQRLKTAALTLKNDFRFAQNRALTGDKTGCAATSTLGGWYVELVDEATNYRIALDCLTGTGEADVSSKTSNFPSDIRISSITYGANSMTEANAFFRTIGQSVSIFSTQGIPADFFDTTAPSGNLRSPPFGIDSDLTVTLSISGSSATYQVMIKPSGEINEYKP